MLARCQFNTFDLHTGKTRTASIPCLTGRPASILNTYVSASVGRVRDCLLFEGYSTSSRQATLTMYPFKRCAADWWRWRRREGREPPEKGSAWDQQRSREATRIPSVTCLKVDCGNQRLATTSVTWREECKLSLASPQASSEERDKRTEWRTQTAAAPSHSQTLQYRACSSLRVELMHRAGDFFPAAQICDKSGIHWCIARVA
jgi:hypothetical protein